ncbi:MAG: hypothetical protein ACXV2E_09025 [Halobacteriota archaeon]
MEHEDKALGAVTATCGATKTVLAAQAMFGRSADFRRLHDSETRDMETCRRYLAC